MFSEDESTSSQLKKDVITPGEDLSALSLDDLAERREILQDEIRRTDDMTEKKKAGRSAADAVFKI